MPIVNYWIPYGAIRDCFPPDDPRRTRVLQWWIAWLIGSNLSLAAVITVFFSTGAALVVSILAALAYVAVIAWSPGIVTAVSAAHRDAMAETEKSGVLTG